jgi:hypothetical protein
MAHGAFPFSFATEKVRGSLRMQAFSSLPSRSLPLLLRLSSALPAPHRRRAAFSVPATDWPVRAWMDTSRRRDDDADMFSSLML